MQDEASSGEGLWYQLPKRKTIFYRILAVSQAGTGHSGLQSIKGFSLKSPRKHSDKLCGLGLEEIKPAGAGSTTFLSSPSLNDKFRRVPSIIVHLLDSGRNIMSHVDGGHSSLPPLVTALRAECPEQVDR